VSIAAGFGERSEPWLAAALVALSVLWALFAAIRRAPSITLPCAALAAVGLATIYAGANAAGAAGIAVALGAGGLLIARAGAGSALLVALVPLTPGFVAVAASAEVSFRGATEAPDGAASAPWAALAALLPVALAASVAVGGRILRSRGVDQNRSTSAAVALLAGAAVAAGIWGVGARGAGGDPAVLSVAVGAGSVAGIAAATRKKPLSVHGPEALAIPSQSTHEGRGARSVGVMLTAIVVADLSAMVLVTLEGLRTGFL
jgi:hypothetical protein